MNYRYFQPEYLFTGKEMLQKATLIVREDDAIEGISFDNHADAIKMDGVLAPGFINCHCHLELSHFKGLIPPGTGMTEFLLQIIEIRKSGLPIIKQAIRDAEEEMKNNGIVAVGDICNGTDTLEVKKFSGLYYHNFIETMGMNAALAEQRMNTALQTYNAFDRLFPGRNTIVPHAPYSVSAPLFAMIEEKLPGKIVTIHNQESKDEADYFKNRSGEMLRLFEEVKINDFVINNSNSLLHAYERIKNAEKIILVHNTFTNEESISNTNTEKTFWCLCPNANLYITETLPPVELFRKMNCKIVIGTDSLASNNQLNLLKELSAIAAAHPQIPLSEMLQWITINGAEALGITEWFGSFEKGKKPGMVNFLLQEIAENISMA